jgi:hypothetical protein
VRAAKTKRAKGSGGFKRLLQEQEQGDDDLLVTFPQSFVWESSEEVHYPMILSSLIVWEVDACVLLPSGHELVAVLDANATEPLPLNGECVQVVVPGEDLVLLFKATPDIFSRALAGRKFKYNEIQGHIEAIEGNSKKSKLPKVIDFSTESRGRGYSKGRGSGN